MLLCVLFLGGLIGHPEGARVLYAWRVRGVWQLRMPGSSMQVRLCAALCPL
jgi:hypothetical protein